MNNIFKLQQIRKAKLNNEIKLRFPSLKPMQIIELLQAFSNAPEDVLQWIQNNTPSLETFEQLQEEVILLKEDVDDLIYAFENEVYEDVDRFKKELKDKRNQLDNLMKG